MLNVVEVRGAVLGAVGGDLVYAHREGVRIARPACEVRAPPADCVVASAPLPVSSSLRQASKLVAPAALLLREGGTAIVVAECPDGVVVPLESSGAHGEWPSFGFSVDFSFPLVIVEPWMHIGFGARLAEEGERL